MFSSSKGNSWRNCGAPPEQKQLAAQQAQQFQQQTAFFKELTDNYNAVFANQQSILKALTDEFQPILDKGPNQTGFSSAEEAALRTDASDRTAAGANQAAIALGAKEATMGDSAIPSGAKLQLEGGLLGSAAQEEAGLQHHITENNYALGRENFLNAANMLGAAASQQNPIGFAGAASGAGNAATGAGSSVNSTYNDIAAENSAWMGPVFGMIGGLGGAAIRH